VITSAARNHSLRETLLPFSPPSVGDEEIEEVAAALRSEWLTTGPRTQRFEREFADRVGAEAALAVSSGTAAMQVALAAAGIGPGHEVITTTMTFCATAHVVHHAGARPVVVDVEADTLNIDPAAVERAVTPKTRAIMPVHLYGHPAEMDRLLEIARAHDLIVIEDAAHALPALYRDLPVGGFGQLCAFSFYATKNLTTGEGGMLTGSRGLVEAARPWTRHGIDRDRQAGAGQKDAWWYDVVLPGFKCNMSDVMSAIGLRQLRKLDTFHARRVDIARTYSNVFGGIPQLQVPTERAHVRSAWHLYALRLHLERLTIDRAQFIEELRARQISASVHFIPLHRMRFYADVYGLTPSCYPVADGEAARLVSLPLHPLLTDTDVADVIEATLDVARTFAR
jgi:dTDP-4-amino-4,6-dideoxygalactose transaminase